MAKNLRHELRTDVMNSFREGMNKHEIKHTEKGRTEVWSYGTKKDLLDKIDVFSKWAKEQGLNHKDQITRTDVTNFLVSKANEGVTARTVDAYRSALGRIGNLSGRDWHVEKVVAATREKSVERGAESVISREHYDKLIDYARENPSKSGACVLLEREIGVRVGDLAYGIKIDGNSLKINSKNGRICTREITPKVREILESKEFKAMTDDKGRVHAPKDDSLNKYLRRTEDKLGIARHSFHDLRRFSAQEKYDELRQNGADRTTALGKVGEWLNHGENRQEMVLESYIANAW